MSKCKHCGEEVDWFDLDISIFGHKCKQKYDVKIKSDLTCTECNFCNETVRFYDENGVSDAFEPKKYVLCIDCAKEKFQSKKHTEKEILELADQLAKSCRYIIEGNVMGLGIYLEVMRKMLINYNNARKE